LLANFRKFCSSPEKYPAGVLKSASAHINYWYYEQAHRCFLETVFRKAKNASTNGSVELLGILQLTEERHYNCFAFTHNAARTCWKIAGTLWVGKCAEHPCNEDRGLQEM